MSPKYTSLGRVDPNSQVAGHFVLSFRLPNGQALALAISHNINLSPFASNDRALILSWNEDTDIIGSARFYGVIGGGKMRISLSKSVNIVGCIKGGPREAQTFVGEGTWLVG